MSCFLPLLRQTQAVEEERKRQEEQRKQHQQLFDSAKGVLSVTGCNLRP